MPTLRTHQTGKEIRQDALDMKKIATALFLLFMLGATLLPVAGQPALPFPPVPAENRQKGKNDHAYLCAIGHPTPQEKAAFLEEVKPITVELRHLHGVHASALIGMAVQESCYGYTRTGVYANNYFGIKKWIDKPEGTYQLIGQPDEDKGKVRVIERLPNGQKIFDETKRKDNRYRTFASKGDAMRYLVEEIFLHKQKPYLQVVEKYRARIQRGMPSKEASRTFLCELAAAGYNHQGCTYYRKAVGAVIDALNLDTLDQQ